MTDAADKAKAIPLYVRPPEVSKAVVERILSNYRVGESRMSRIVKNVEKLCKATKSMPVKHVDVYAILYNHCYGHGFVDTDIDERVPGQNGEMNLMQFNKFFNLWRNGDSYQKCMEKTILWTREHKDEMPRCPWIDDDNRVMGTATHTRIMYSSFNRRYSAGERTKKSLTYQGVEELSTLLNISYPKMIAGQHFIVIPVQDIPYSLIPFIEQNAKYQLNSVLTEEQKLELAQSQRAAKQAKEAKPATKEQAANAESVIEKLRRMQQEAIDSGQADQSGTSGVPEDELLDELDTIASEEADEEELQSVSDFDTEAGVLDEEDEEEWMDKPAVYSVNETEEEPEPQEDTNFIDELAKEQENEVSVEDAMEQLRQLNPEPKAHPTIEAKKKASDPNGVSK